MSSLARPTGLSANCVLAQVCVAEKLEKQILRDGTEFFLRVKISHFFFVLSKRVPTDKTILFDIIFKLVIFVS